MSTTIPYDPTLVLGNVVNPTKIKNLQAIAEAQKPVDDAQLELNSYILSKRSLDMTLQEMMNMNVDEKDLNNLAKEIDTLKGEMAASAGKLATATIGALKKITGLRQGQDQKQIGVSVESPMDYNKSAIKQMPLSSDSMVMDAQYFRFESNSEGTDAHSTAIASYVSTQVSGFLSPTYGVQAGASAKHVMESQHANHKIEGTLVITANCSHKMSDVFAPFVLEHA